LRVAFKSEEIILQHSIFTEQKSKGRVAELGLRRLIRNQETFFDFPEDFSLLKILVPNCCPDFPKLLIQNGF